MIEAKPRFFVLVSIALAALAVLHGPADADRSPSVCGVPLRIADPDIRASFEAFDRIQSAGAAMICRIASNTRP